MEIVQLSQVSEAVNSEIADIGLAGPNPQREIPFEIAAARIVGANAAILDAVNAPGRVKGQSQRCLSHISLPFS
jgi:hypothetical protein